MKWRVTARPLFFIEKARANHALPFSAPGNRQRSAIARYESRKRGAVAVSKISKENIYEKNGKRNGKRGY